MDIQALPLGALQNLHHAVEYEIYPSWRYRYPPGVERNTEHWFALEVPPSAAIRVAPREHLQYVWLPYQEAAQKCFSHTNRDAILRFYDNLSALK
ncbi:MAG: dihydroneopterin triphosphate diphosphatase [Burkholderiaceae bacterium]|nr:dihydroneopterin triphosphate diphosphatase [Burkholderiaceae bacterium]